MMLCWRPNRPLVPVVVDSIGQAADPAGGMILNEDQRRVGPRGAKNDRIRILADTDHVECAVVIHIHRWIDIEAPFQEDRAVTADWAGIDGALRRTRESLRALSVAAAGRRRKERVVG